MRLEHGIPNGTYRAGPDHSNNCPVRLADKPWLKILLADLL